MFNSQPLVTYLQNLGLGSAPLWVNQNVACLEENINIAVQLLFIGVFLLQSIAKFFSTQQKSGTNYQARSSTRVSLGFSFKLSIVCSIALMINHVAVLLLMFLGGQGSHCSLKGRAFSSEILRVLLWAASTAGLFRAFENRLVMFPWFLRAWWPWSFVMSITSVALDTHFMSIAGHSELRLRDYADIVSLVLSACLFGVSIRGKTGIFVMEQAANRVTEPLINSKSEKHVDLNGKRESPYGKASLFQLVTFSWLNQLFSVGYKKALEQKDIPGIDVKDSAEFLSRDFDENLEYARERGATANPSIYIVIYYFVRRKAAINACFAVTNAAASYVGPYLINDFVTFLSEKESESLRHGYVLALAFLVAKMVETTAQRQWIFGARQLGLRLRAAMISRIYRKGLVLSSQSRQNRTSGEMINYMSVDIQRITDFMWFLNIIWMLPIQISLAIYILHTNIGIGSAATFLATLAVLSCNIPLTRFQKRYQSMIMEAKDERMKATSEILRNMKILKLQAWDVRFRQKLEELRSVERSWLWKSIKLNALGAFIFWGSPTFISVATFGSCVAMGIELTAGRVLAALATFRMLQDPIFALPDLLSVIAQGKVSADRIASFFREEELQRDAVEIVARHETEFDVCIQNGKFRWDAESNAPTLEGINLRVKRGTKVAVCGTVGSGKSSLLSSILGEMQKLSGVVEISGSKAYVSQSPWILTGNVRDNILFGNRYDRDKYERTVEACALVKDFELFPCGDMTEIGERGINMSGGQKQRIQIARAVYQDADVYLLDDPFSAVDAHTGTQLFHDCLMGILREKTIIFVTHQVEFLPAADLILVMENGKIAQAGTFEELLKENIGFEALVGAHSQALDSILTVENTSRSNQVADGESRSSSEHLQARQESDHDLSLEITEKTGKFIQDEEREKGSIGKEVYWAYLTIVKNGALVPIIILAQSSFQVLQIASNYWIAWSCPTKSGTEPKVGINTVLLIYTLLAVGGSLCVLLRASLVGIAGLWTAEKLFMNMLHSVLRAPMSFFDSTPTGRILSRASMDQSIVDLEMPQKLGWCAFSIIMLLGTVGVMSQVAWELFIIFIPVTAVCIWFQRYYIPTARELARLEGIQRSPILHHFSESLSGVSTIRAFQQETRFIEANIELIDEHSIPWFHNVAAMEWLSFRLNVLSNFVFAFSLLLLVTLPEGIINPSIAGLAVTYGINLNVLQANVIWNICNAENKMISVERIIQYSKIVSEAPLLIENSRPPNDWPASGTIRFKNLHIRYADHLPSVLKNIDCTFPGGKKIGVVGRTGSGKSTLIQALFRIVEPIEGSIVIDGVDTRDIGLHDLRSRLSIIPQDPTMFEGTVRGNLDPLHQHSDSEAWQALEQCQLAALVGSKEKKLDAIVVENGENWSVGQRQLLCLGRALLKKSSILVLDEATASVDSATDSAIQKIIGKEFENRTVVTIAHRIHTVVESDLVLVLSDGRIAEYDSPSRLLEREDSFFSKLVKEYSSRSKNFNSLTAKK